MQFDVETFETRLSDVVDTVSDAMDTNCALIPLWQQVCTDDESTCQLATVEIQTSENSIITLTHALFPLNGVCELPNFPSSVESIERCHNGQRWTTSEGINKRYTFLEEMLQGYHNYVTRNRRFAVTGPIAIGLFSGTGAVAASIAIAREEGNRISREQNILRNIDSQVALAKNLKNNNISIELGKVADFQKYITALSAQTSVNYHNAEDLNTK